MTEDYTHTMTKGSKITMANEDLERMTDSNGDLVSKVAQAMYPEYDQGTALMETLAKEAARKAISAVLDDLQNPSDGMVAAADKVADETWNGPDLYLVWLEMLDAKRAELGLSRPEKPGDAVPGIDGPGWPQP